MHHIIVHAHAHITRNLIQKKVINHPPNRIDNSGKTVQTRPFLAPISNPQTQGGG